MAISDEKLRVLKANNAESNLFARKCIRDALIVMLRQTNYDDIRMTDIIRKSGISRSGVYNNYKNKDEIMLDIYKKPLDDVLTALTTSIFTNLELIFKTVKDNGKAIKALNDAGLSYKLLELMNAHYEGISASFYIPLWNGMLYNAIAEWVNSGMNESVEEITDRMKDGLKLIAESIELDLTNTTQNKKL